MNTSCTCGCCEGVRIDVPAVIANRPGLPTLACRVGTHATFLETMIARLSSKDFPALAALKTRDPGDAAMALLDGWALVADVLTFYQERIANEGYLRTATERRSILELARLVGYTLRPGVAATVYLAYTLDVDSSQTPPQANKTIIPAGARSQSVPGPGELPQSFETSEDLDARSDWNDLSPRRTRPQVITLDPVDLGDKVPLPKDPGTDARTRDTLYFAGTATSLSVGDPLIIVVGEGQGMQAMRFVESVDLQTADDRTETVLQPDPEIEDNEKIDATLLTPFISDAATLFAGSSVADRVAEILNELSGQLNSTTETDEAQQFVRAAIPKIADLHDLALKRNFTRLEPWLRDVLRTLDRLRQIDPGGDIAAPAAAAVAVPVPSPLGKLGSLLEALSLPATIQPVSALRLNRSVQQEFSPASDIAPKLIGALKPELGDVLYKAWAAADVPGASIEVDALRVKAGFFPGAYPGLPTVDSSGTTTFDTPPSIENSWRDFSDPNQDTLVLPDQIALDGVYDKIIVGSWVVIDFPTQPDGIVLAAASVTTDQRKKTFHKVAGVRVAQLATSDKGYTAKATLLKLDPPWLSGIVKPDDKGTIRSSLDSPVLLHGTIVYAQSENLDLAEEPLDIDIEGDTIELDDIYEGLEPGRWIIVSGERTDIPDVSGVSASELAMIAGVEQGARPLLCAPFPSGTSVPFSEIYSVTDPNEYGDRLVVGELAVPVSSFLQSPFKVPDMPNQQFCDQVQLAKDFWVNAYVPTLDELSGDFSDFDGLLVDAAGNPVPQGKIKGGRNVGDLWAWRIPSAKAHTILTLAAKLAYSYDLDSVIIYGNVVKATHGETINEPLGNGDASRELQQFTLKQPPLTFVSAANPSGIDSTLKAYVNNVAWHEVDSLAGLEPTARNFVTQTDDEDKTTLTFGNGVHGARLPTGMANVQAIYRSGIGKPGNVKAGQITQLQTRPLNVDTVVNPLRASGGADRDDRDQARRNVPIACLALDRLVAVRDYADFSRSFAGIGKSSAARLSDGRRQLVHVTIAGADNIPIDLNSDLYRNLTQALREQGDPFEPLQVALRRLKLLVIGAQVRILPDYLWEPVADTLRSTLLDTFGFNRRDLGQPVFQSEVISALLSVPGVLSADLQVLDSVSEDITAAQLAGLADQLKARDFVCANLARPNTNPVNYPDDAILPAELVFLTPDVPQTLVLNQVNP
jgi:hypothetical protein